MKDLERLKTKIEGHEVYEAGIPTFARNFTRDAIISGILMQNAGMLKNQLEFCAEKQGKKKNSFTGEEPGKIFHEYPAIIKRGLSPEYNSCDSTALFLIGHEVYKKLTGDEKFAEKHKTQIEKAAGYIKKHLKSGGFFESPEFSGAKKSSLNVTYWKDSEIVDREAGIPKYPVVYFLAQAQNYRGMKSALFLLEDKALEKNIKDMKKFLDKNLYDEKNKKFYLAIDKQGPLSAESSDELHSLFYLDKTELKPDVVEAIIHNSYVLETPYGYRTLSEKDSYRVSDPYHAMTLWPYEQAVINIGARKFNLKRVEKVSSRITKHLTTAPEIFDIIQRENKKIFRKGGCEPQLWTVAAREYFRKKKDYRIVV